MKKNSLINLLFTILLLTIVCSIANAQPGGNPPPGGGNEFAPDRPKLLPELGLTKDQIQQIRRINVQLRPQMQAAKKRLDDANFALDEAIYGDKASDSDIQERMKEVQLAHAEMIKNRTFSETSIRKVLTPAQLIRFREMRQRFKPAQNRQMNNDGRPNNMEKPNQNRLKTLPKPR